MAAERPNLGARSPPKALDWKTGQARALQTMNKPAGDARNPSK